MVLDGISDMIDWCSSLKRVIKPLSKKVESDINAQDDWNKLEGMYDPVNNYFQRVY